MILDGFSSKYPYTDFHTMNLDWLLAQMLQLRTDMKDFVNLNTIKYADPIQWNITTQYQGNTVVIEPVTGDAYLSTQPVPAGVAITDTEYWTIIGSFGTVFTDIKASIAAADEGPSTVASDNRAVDDLVWLADKLYVITAPIATGETYVPGTNCELITVEMLLKKEKTEREEFDTIINGSILTMAGQIENISGSVAAIGGEVDTINGQIEDISEKISDVSVRLFVPKTVQTISGDSAGECSVLIYQGNKGIIFDFAAVESAQSICDQINAAGVEEITAAFISHYHADHISAVSGLTTFKSNLNMANTVFYVQDGGTSTWATIATQVRNIFTDNVFNYPTEGEVVTIDDIKITCGNCGSSTIAYWESVASGDYNDQSMYNYIEYGDNCIFLTHDITYRVQDRLYESGNYKSCNLCTVPHHGANASGNNQLGLETGASLAYVCDNPNGYYNWDPFMVAQAHSGVRIYRNAANSKPIEFTIFKSGGIVPNNTLHFQGCQYNTVEAIIDIYVDSTHAQGDRRTGSSQHPYLNARSAISECVSNLRYKIHILNTPSDSVVVMNKNMEIIGEGDGSKTLGYTTIRDGSTVKMSHVTTGGLAIYDSHVIIEDSTVRDITAQHSFLRVDRVESSQNGTNFITATGCTVIATAFALTKTYDYFLMMYYSTASVTPSASDLTGCSHIFGGNQNNDFMGFSRNSTTELQRTYGGDGYKLVYDSTANAFKVANRGSLSSI